MTLKEAIQKDGQRYLYVKLAITSGTTQYIMHLGFKVLQYLLALVVALHYAVAL